MNDQEIGKCGDEISNAMRGYAQLGQHRLEDGSLSGAWWQESEQAGRIDCYLCPRKCHLKPGDRGFCFVRENRDGEMVLSTYGKSTGFCIDPIEKKPLNHFYPGTPVLSFGTAGCNLGCKFCQNWDISKSREVQRLSAHAEPDQIAAAAVKSGCRSVAFTYNDPVIWAEYAIDTARACHQVGLKAVAVTAGYICQEARGEFFEHIDAANIDLKAFTEDFYFKVTYSHIAPVLETLRYLKRETDVWFEITNLIIPNANDSPDELRKMCDWIVREIGDEVPIHFTAFHPDFRMTDRGRTDPQTLSLAQDIARSEGIKYAYVGNVNNVARQSTYCHNCQALLVERDWYRLGQYGLDASGRCGCCGVRIPGHFDAAPGQWGPRRQPINFERDAATLPLADVGPALPKATNGVGSPTYLPQKEGSAMNAKSAQATAMTQPVPPTVKMLPIDRLSGQQRQVIVQSAADWVADAVLGRQPRPAGEAVGELAESIVMGVFVTLKRDQVLRGCCGVLGKPMPLGQSIASAAFRTAREDQRMAPISPCELPYLNIDVTLLGPFKQIAAEGPARVDAIEIGRHGLMIQRGQQSGLLLPSVATERGWNALQFLQAVCNKAKLPPSAWEQADAKVMTFEGVPINGRLPELLPDDLPKSKPLPLTAEQVAEYAQVAGRNIVAFATGGTPSYVLPNLPDVNVNAIVLSMQWGATASEGQGSAAEEDGSPAAIKGQLRQGHALNVSYRPGMALQSSLYQMCQKAASMFQQQRFSGQLQVGLTVGFDPAMHGYGEQADLQGIEPSQRAIVISDPRNCGFAYDPQQSPEELRMAVRELLPIGSRDSAVYSLQVLSTMPKVISKSGPHAKQATGVRPPAVAGTFYPAQDAARRAMVDSLLQGDAPEKTRPLAIMVPHAGLKYSGKVAAGVWSSLEGIDSRSLLIISPKHTAHGVNWAACPYDSWGLSETVRIAGDSGLASEIAGRVEAVELDAAAHQHEHGIEVQLPILEKLAPEASVAALALHGGSWPDIQMAAKQLAEVLSEMDSPPLLVISSDMNHYAPDVENRRRDRLALDALATGDPQHLIDVCSQNDISMCGLIPAALVLETLHQMGKSFRVQETGYATSADTSGDKSQVVGYAGALLLES